MSIIVANAESLVVLRWDSPGGRAVRKLVLPVGEDPKGRAALKKLLQDCAPATFGKDGVDVLDESYRKAAKLDNSQFSTTCNSHDVGIIDVIAQTVLPGYRRLPMR